MNEEERKNTAYQKEKKQRVISAKYISTKMYSTRCDIKLQTI
jgi:hypothetical protein